MSYEEIWKKAAKEVAKERDCLNDKLNQAYEDGYQMEGKYRDMKTQRDTLIDDIAVLKANISRLERENECEKEWFYKYSCELEHIVKHERDTIKRLEKRVSELVHENVRLQNDLFTEELNQDEADFVIEKLRKQYTTLTDHIRDMKFASPYSYNYIHLVNFIKELERD